MSLDGRRRVSVGKVSPQLSVPRHIERCANTPTTPFHLTDSPSIARLSVCTSPAEILRLKTSCKLARQALNFAGSLVVPGVSTDWIDSQVHDFIVNKQHAYPAPLGYRGFPKSICTSINEILCHGIPDDRELQHGDLVSIDVSLYKNGYHGDCCSAFPVVEKGELDSFLEENPRISKLLTAGKKCLSSGVNAVKPGLPLSRIGRAISKVCDEYGYKVPNDLCGHGVGKQLHMEPTIFHTRLRFISYETITINIGNKRLGRAQPGMVFTIEPIVTEGKTAHWKLMEDKWTIVHKDRRAWSAQFEHTLIVTEDGCEVLTVI